jgi:hypothetical protein
VQIIFISTILYNKMIIFNNKVESGSTLMYEKFLSAVLNYVFWEFDINIINQCGWFGIDHAYQMAWECISIFCCIFYSQMDWKSMNTHAYRKQHECLYSVLCINWLCTQAYVTKYFSLTPDFSSYLLYDNNCPYVGCTSQLQQ